MTIAAPLALDPSPSGRIAGLDVLRGLAVAGIALLNVIAFAMPGPAYFNPRAYGAENGLDYALYGAVFVLVEDKFRTLFAMLFGVGVAILWQRGRGWGGHLARMVALLAIGVVHATVLASNDVLRLYALTGLVLPLFLRLGPRWLLGLSVAISVATFVVLALVARHYLIASVPAVPDGSWLIVPEAEARFGPYPPAIEASLEMGRESFGERIERRLTTLAAPLVLALGALPLTLSHALLGIALWRFGLLRGTWSRRASLRLAGLCAAVAVPALLALAIWNARADFAAVVVGANALAFSLPFDTLLAVAWAALAVALAGNARGSFARMLAAAGRLSLTNYLGTSVIFAAIFAQWGLGLFGEVGRSQAYAIALVPVTAMLALSPLWLARFGQGPAERIWRRLAGQA